ncbi:hypothetical protein SAMD00023353_0802890 [Rosellinia necatrix]|uniref:Uncharacterized protein n=1 Tax=Rosellinia necatrix TaxID=77044 RepID=A0A1W2TBD6_ROSNE|nr:hypothetical protein SAMD00023353_0802890 [Rosellinia necatrix]
MDAISAYSFASGAWHALQAAPLILGPQAITSFLAPPPPSEYPRAAPSGEVEQYLARSLGFALLALGLVTIVLTGSVPVGSVLDSNRDAPSPYAAPVILLTTLYHAADAFRGWAWYAATGRAGYFLGFAGAAALAAFGTWCLLFGGERARISRRTGADKRTSGFPFRNAEADRRKAR